MQMNICENFTSLSPFDIREKKFADVFLLIRRLNIYSKNKDKKTKIRKPAGDNWF